MQKWPTNRRSPSVRMQGWADTHVVCHTIFTPICVAFSLAETSRSQRKQRERLQKGLLAALGVLCGIGLSVGVTFALAAWDRSAAAAGRLDFAQGAGAEAGAGQAGLN